MGVGGYSANLTSIFICLTLQICSYFHIDLSNAITTSTDTIDITYLLKSIHNHDTHFEYYALKTTHKHDTLFNYYSQKLCIKMIPFFKIFFQVCIILQTPMVGMQFVFMFLWSNIELTLFVLRLPHTTIPRLVQEH